MPTLLHVGCGPARRQHIATGFHAPGWSELRLDIDEANAPDFVATMTDMRCVADASVDAVYASHNLEHLYPHEVPLALAEFRRVLAPGGFAVLLCPDLQSVAALVAEGRLEETAYVSPAGPIAPLDMLYGHRASLAKGNLYMAHRCGFTEGTLVGAVNAAGFPTIGSRRRGSPYFELAVIASSAPRSSLEMQSLSASYLPD